MKKHLLIAAFMLFAAEKVFAQSEKTIIIKQNGNDDEQESIEEVLDQTKYTNTNAYPFGKC